MRVLWITLVAAAIASPAAAQDAALKSGGPLARYAACKFSNGLSVDSATRLTGKGTQYRSVMTTKGEKRVSAIDGYRFLLAQGSPSYFAEIRVESPDPVEYPDDRDVAIDNLHYVLQSAVGKPYWEHDSRDGFEVYGETDSSFGERGPTGQYVIANDALQTLITINFLGQAPQDRRFVNIDEHDEIRDGVIDALIKCGRSHR